MGGNLRSLHARGAKAYGAGPRYAPHDDPRRANMDVDHEASIGIGYAPANSRFLNQKQRAHENEPTLDGLISVDHEASETLLDTGRHPRNRHERLRDLVQQLSGVLFLAERRRQ